MLITERLKLETDLPPLKWSSVRYDFDEEDKINGKEAVYS